MLVVVVLGALPRDALVGEVAQVFQDEQAHHQAYWLARAAGVRAVEFREGLLERLPRDLAGECEERVAAVARVLHAEEEALLVAGGWLYVHGVSPVACQPAKFSPSILPNLADSVQRFFAFSYVFTGD